MVKMLFFLQFLGQKMQFLKIFVVFLANVVYE